MADPRRQWLIALVLALAAGIQAHIYATGGGALHLVAAVGLVLSAALAVAGVFLGRRR